MFTGLVEAMGTVRAVAPDQVGGRTLSIAIPFATELVPGESVAINGCCLTVVHLANGVADFQAGPETLAKTNLGQLRVNDAVNLERAMKLSDRLGGHFVTGHVDGVGTIAARELAGEWQTVWFAAPSELLLQMVPKGSIAVDGVSLTVVDVTDMRFSVMLIPHTLDHTTLGRHGVGALVNLETDLIGKHVTRWLSAYHPR